MTAPIINNKLPLGSMYIYRIFRCVSFIVITILLCSFFLKDRKNTRSVVHSPAKSRMEAKNAHKTTRKKARNPALFHDIAVKFHASLLGSHFVKGRALDANRQSMITRAETLIPLECPAELKRGLFTGYVDGLLIYIQSRHLI